MDKREEYLRFDNETDTSIMSPENVLEYLQLRKESAIESLEIAKSDPSSTQKILEYWTNEIETCDKNIKEIQLKFS